MPLPLPSLVPNPGRVGRALEKHGEGRTRAQRGGERARDILELELEGRQRLPGQLQTDVSWSWTRGIKHYFENSNPARGQVLFGRFDRTSL